MTQRNQPADASRPRHRVDHARDANRRHSKFGVLPAFTSSEPSKAEVAAVKILFPGVHNNDIFVVLAASLAVACDMDDIIEALPPRVGKIALDDCIKIIQGRSPIDKSGKVQRVAQALRNHVQEPLSHGAPKHSSKLENGDCIVHIVKHISLLCQSHLEWCASAKRYRIKEASSTESPPLQVFYSGMFHGLPSFPENTIGLTALITSATGLSGHHMARVLAASPRWTKIYRLSFRAPQQGFGSTKIEHLRVNFLDKPSHIASLLGAIKHVQAILHSLPVPKEDAVDVWGNPAEVSRVNCMVLHPVVSATANPRTVTLFNNFIVALQQTSLKPKRLMLQTGSKHCAFYMSLRLCLHLNQILVSLFMRTFTTDKKTCS
ncbi:hypothetical protein S40293_10599 [Stachybotrys chartarum IBT 40293]|nr:hypothetical protein S40293_10599 [Stachybotrys chartarum IBT 40293]